MKKKIRPLSPHLAVYKPQVTSVFSIFHRVSGSSLSIFFTLVITLLYLKFFFTSHFYFYAFMINYVTFAYIVVSSVGSFLVFIFCFHIINGIRHMLWDFGVGLELKNLTATSFCVFFINALIITIMIFL